MRRSLVLLVSTALLVLSACAAPMQDRDTAAQPGITPSDVTAPTATTADRDGSGVTAPVPVAAPPVGGAGSDTAPAPGGRGVTVDLNCQSNADCAIKNVGSCCGEHPACVNINSPTDPEGVQALCAQEGMVSTCGFPVISSCQCVQGRCEGSNAAVLE